MRVFCTLQIVYVALSTIVANYHIYLLTFSKVYTMFGSELEISKTLSMQTQGARRLKNYSYMSL